MHLKRLRVENFRALEEIDVEFETLVSVIIGPNAIGKTTVLEAVRLAKGVLAPRTQNEPTQVLISLGAMSPHMPQRLLGAALTSRTTVPLVVKCSYEVSSAEVETLSAIAPQLASGIALQSAGITFANPSQAVAFQNSPVGQEALNIANSQVRAETTRLEMAKRLNLNLSIDFQTNQIKGDFPIQQQMFAALDQALPPNQSLFSYFPADRALPAGEQPVQLGTDDTAAQLESYNSQPQIKYNRLKNTIFNAIILREDGRNRLNSEFKAIFERILRGRRLGEMA